MPLPFHLETSWMWTFLTLPGDGHSGKAAILRPFSIAGRTPEFAWVVP